MATAAQWVEGARPRTLPAAVAPVAGGHRRGGRRRRRSSCGRRWSPCWSRWRCRSASTTPTTTATASAAPTPTGSARSGWSGSGAAAPAPCERAAVAAFGVAAAARAGAGRHHVVVAGRRSGRPRIAAAWLYTGGPAPLRLRRAGRALRLRLLRAGRRVRHDVRPGRPGHRASVLVAVAGRVPGLRDPGRQQPARHPDRRRVAGKRTLAVRLGDAGTRRLYAALVLAAVRWSPLVLAAPAGTGRACSRCSRCRCGRPGPRRCRAGTAGRDLIPVLRDTGRAELASRSCSPSGLALH